MRSLLLRRMSPVMARFGPRAMSAIRSLSGVGETGRPLLEVAATAEKLGEPPQVPRGCWEQNYVPAHNPRAVLLRQKSKCDNQSHQARENQQCREGFSDHWHRRMARSRENGLRFRPSLEPPDFALCR
jgi:hypothetical protein